jgi:hypothetical protein
LTRCVKGSIAESLQLIGKKMKTSFDSLMLKAIIDRPTLHSEPFRELLTIIKEPKACPAERLWK